MPDIIFSDWIVDAFVDSVKTVPFLFIVFLMIEILEHFFADKIKSFLKHSKSTGPVAGSIVSSIPQCGFSVVASTLYCEGFITRGTIIAVYLATSDEAIPVLLTYPKFLPYILPLIIVKLIVAIPVGYFVDKFFKVNEIKADKIEKEHIEGCCRHEIVVHRKRDFLIHPTKHTLSVFLFILAITLILNYLLETYDITNYLQGMGSYIAPLLSAVIGLIPNCAISVGLVLLFIKGAISFGTLISGLMTSSGIGLLILFKNNSSRKDTAFILFILVLVGFLSGVCIQFAQNFA